MKRFFILVTMLFQLLSFVQAQQANEFGIKTGLSSSYLSMDTTGSGQTFDTKKVGGFYIGLFADLYQQDAFSAVASFGFIEKGGYEAQEIKNTSGLVIGQQKIDYVLRYASLAVEGKLKIKLEEVPNLYPYIAVGPRIDYLLSHTTSLDYSISTLIAGANIGFGFDYDFPNVSALIEFRKLYNFSKNLSKQANVTIQDNTFYIAIGLKYPLRKKI